MKHKLIFGLLVLFTVSSCHKKENNNFLIGQWKHTGYACRNECVKGFESGVPAIENYDKKIILEITPKELIFSSEIGTEKFKIVKVEEKTVTREFQEFASGNKISLKDYVFHLKSKKRKDFLFTYSVMNDSIVIGDYWLKDQKYAAFDAPNFFRTECIEYQGWQQVSQGLISIELLGKFEKIN